MVGTFGLYQKLNKGCGMQMLVFCTAAFVCFATIIQVVARTSCPEWTGILFLDRVLVSFAVWVTVLIVGWNLSYLVFPCNEQAGK